MRGGETVSRRAHNPKIAGSIPAPANYYINKKYAGVMELVDMLGLEPSALRCAGSSPVPGNSSLKFVSLVFYSYLTSVSLLIIGNSLIGRASDSESEG